MWNKNHLIIKLWSIKQILIFPVGFVLLYEENNIALVWEPKINLKILIFLISFSEYLKIGFLNNPVLNFIKLIRITICKAT